MKLIRLNILIIMIVGLFLLSLQFAGGDWLPANTECCRGYYTNEYMACSSDADCNEYPSQISFCCDQIGSGCSQSCCAGGLDYTSVDNFNVDNGDCKYKMAGCRSVAGQQSCVYFIENDLCRGVSNVCVEDEKRGCCGYPGNYEKYDKTKYKCCTDGATYTVYDPLKESCCTDYGAYTCETYTSIADLSEFGIENKNLGKCCCGGVCCEEDSTLEHECQKCYRDIDAGENIWYYNNKEEGEQCLVEDPDTDILGCGACIRASEEGENYKCECTPNSRPEIIGAIPYSSSNGGEIVSSRDPSLYERLVLLYKSFSNSVGQPEKVFIIPLKKSLENEVFYQGKSTGFKLFTADDNKSPPPEGDRTETPKENLICQFDVTEAYSIQQDGSLEPLIKINPSASGSCENLKWDPGIAVKNLPVWVKGEVSVVDDGRIVEDKETCRGQNIKSSDKVEKEIIVCPTTARYKGIVSTQVNLVSDIKIPYWWNILGLRINIFPQDPDVKTNAIIDTGEVDYATGDGIPKEVSFDMTAEGYFHWLTGQKMREQPVLEARKKINEKSELIYSAVPGFPYTDDEIELLIYKNIHPHDLPKDAPYVKDNIHITFKDNFDVIATETVTITEKGKSPVVVSKNKVGKGNLFNSFLGNYIDASKILDKNKLASNQLKGLYMAAVMNKIICDLTYLDYEDVVENVSKEGKLLLIQPLGEDGAYMESIWIDISDKSGNSGDRLKQYFTAKIDNKDIIAMNQITKACRSSNYLSEDYVVPFLDMISRCNPRGWIEDDEWSRYWEGNFPLQQETQ